MLFGRSGTMEEDREGFWTVVRRLRRELRIPRQWKRQDIRDALVGAGYSNASVDTIPSNQSVSRDGRIQGNYVKNGLPPKAYRVGPATFELIDEAGSDGQPARPKKHVTAGVP